MSRYLWGQVICGWMFPRTQWELPSSTLEEPGLHQRTPRHANTELTQAEAELEGIACGVLVHTDKETLVQ